MNKFLTVSSLTLFWAFFEVSDGVNFQPASANTPAEDISTSTERYNFRDAYVPFSDPIITQALPEIAVNTPEPAGIVQASFQEDMSDAIAAPVTVAQTTTKPDLDAARADIRIVSGNRVNMRSGPSTNYDVLATLARGAQAEVIQINAEDWAQVRELEGGQTGWMAAWLLSN